MNESFDRLSLCEKRLQDLLQLNGDGPIEKGILGAFVDLCEKKVPQSKPGLAIQLGQWVIRTEDLNALAAIRDAVIPAVGSAYTWESLTAGGITAITFAVTELLYNISQAGAQVSSRKARILAIMKRFGRPVSTDDLWSQPTEDGDMEWSREKIQEELEGLQEVVTRGGVRKMVEKLKDGRWMLNGV